MAFFLRGDLYIGTKQYEKAVSDFDAAIRLNGRYFFHSWRDRALAHYLFKEYQKFIDDMTIYLSLVLEPDRNFVMIRGRTYEALARETEDKTQKAEYLKKAEADYAWARELGWDGIK
jgi:tetratricopeptide (TPR) repeat protein